MENTFKETKHSYMNIFLLILFALQPIMDVLSFWLIELGKSTTVTLLLRMLLFAATVLVGFLVSRHKWIYFVTAGVLISFWAIHYWNCYRIGYPGLMVDVSNYFRLIQTPVFILAFLSIFRHYGDSILPVRKYILMNYGIILLVLLLSVLTGTDPHTYSGDQIGVMGWFYNGNTQSAIITMLVPLTIYTAYHSKKKWFFIVTTTIGFANLFFTGTRVTYFAVFIITGCFLFALVVNKCKIWFYYMVPLVLAIVCASCYTLSPMYERLSNYNNHVHIQQEQADSQMPEAEKPTVGDEAPSDDVLEKYRVIYESLPRYQPMIEKFGLNAVLKQLNYSTNMSELNNARLMKNTYNYLLFNQQDTMTKLFGMHLEMEYCGSENYDAENDLLGIFFLYGYVGLILYLLFIAGFVIYFLLSLIRGFQKVFTLEYACVVASLCMAVITFIFTAGMLRRPNGSFYLSLFIAYGCYLIERSGVWDKGKTLLMDKSKKK